MGQKERLWEALEVDPVQTPRCQDLTTSWALFLRLYGSTDTLPAENVPTEQEAAGKGKRGRGEERRGEERKGGQLNAPADRRGHILYGV